MRRGALQYIARRRQIWYSGVGRLQDAKWEGTLHTLPVRRITILDALSLQRQCLYNVPWLTLRARMYQIGWDTSSEIEQNLTLIGRYMQDHWDDQTRLWRVLHLLNEVHKRHPSVKSLLMARTKVRRYYSASMFADKGIHFDTDADSQITRDWDRIDVQTRTIIIKDLESRWDGSGRPARELPELHHFLQLVGAVQYGTRVIS